MKHLITVDCGNSTVDLVDHRSGMRRWFPGNEAAAGEIAKVLSDAGSCRLIVSSVSDGSRGVLLEAAAGAAMTPELAGTDLPCPISLDYSPASGLGTDRWLGAMAAFRKYGASIIVDCGSATTVNFIDKCRVFRGGAIGPGLAAIQRGMALVTPGLPAADLDGSVEMPATSPGVAVRSGVLLGYAGLVERLVSSCWSSAGGAVRVVLTGGNAGRLLRWTRLRAVHVPDLVHQGLRELAEGEG